MIHQSRDPLSLSIIKQSCFPLSGKVSFIVKYNYTLSIESNYRQKYV
ncbi:MAG: hypothetical protein [Olavius algarvensis Gamma 3 endosymbiont]|nr:MAG: hypothetical protein [Olavius algarvensis Gamma 3 endosymbiont]